MRLVGLYYLANPAGAFYRTEQNRTEVAAAVLPSQDFLRIRGIDVSRTRFGAVGLPALSALGAGESTVTGDRLRDPWYYVALR